MEHLIAYLRNGKGKLNQQKITLRQLVRFPHYETIFKFVFFIMILIIVYANTDIAQYKKYTSENNIRSFNIYDLKWLIFGIVLIHGLKNLNNYLVYDFVKRNLPEKYQGQDRVLRTQKVVKWIYDSFYYFTSSITCYYLFKDEKWFPTQIGGTNFEHQYYDYPNMPDHPWLPAYYMIQASSHAHVLLLLMAHGTKIELKFWEYLLHHTLACSLLYFSTTYNTMAIGTVVLILHDISDFFLSFGRVYGDLNPKEKIGVFTCFSLIQISWIYTRVYVFPLKIYETVLSNPYMYSHWDEFKFCMINQVGHMLVLFAMHIYWTIFMVKVGLGIFSSGRYKNVYDNRESKLDHNNDHNKKE